MANKKKQTTEINEVEKEINTALENLTTGEGEIEHLTIETLMYKFRPYDVYCAGKEQYKVKVTNLGFGDVKDLLTNKVIYTNETAVFEKTAILTSTSFPEIRIEYIK